MQNRKIFLPKPVNAASREKHGYLSRIFTTSGICLLVLFVLTTGCNTKNESSNASAKENPKTASPSAGAQKTINNQPQKVEADSSVSKEAQKSQTQEQFAIKVTFIELGSVNCIPCKKMQPILKEIEKEYKDQVKVVFHDVWTEQGRPFAMKYRIRVIPTQVFLDKYGKEYFRHEGFFPKEQLVEVLKKQGVK